MREEVQEGPPQEESWEEAAVPGDLLQARPPRLSGPLEALLIAADRPVNRPVLEARTDGVVADVPLDLKSQVTGASAQTRGRPSRKALRRRGSDLTLEQNSQYSVLRCASQDHC